MSMPVSIETLRSEAIQPRPGRGGWHGGPTPSGAVRGVDADEAHWTPAPGRKSIWQLVLHIASWKYAVRRRLEGGKAARFPRSPANWPRVREHPDPAACRAYVELLAAEHERLLEIRTADVPWVAEQLMKHGNREAWLAGARLCR
jgi:hypothetical protein